MDSPIAPFDSRNARMRLTDQLVRAAAGSFTAGNSFSSSLATLARCFAAGHAQRSALVR